MENQPTFWKWALSSLIASSRLPTSLKSTQTRPVRNRAACNGAKCIMEDKASIPILTLVGHHFKLIDARHCPMFQSTAPTTPAAMVSVCERSLHKDRHGVVPSMLSRFSPVMVVVRFLQARRKSKDVFSGADRWPAAPAHAPLGVVERFDVPAYLLHHRFALASLPLDFMNASKQLLHRVASH